MKDWKTWAIVALAVWCIYLTHGLRVERDVAREMAIAAASDTIAEPNFGLHERFFKVTQGSYEEVPLEKRLKN